MAKKIDKSTTEAIKKLLQQYGVKEEEWLKDNEEMRQEW